MCQAGLTRRQQSVLKVAKRSIETHSSWYRQAGNCGLLCITPCVCAWATAKERGTYAAIHKYYNNFSANKKSDLQTHEREGSAVFLVGNVKCHCHSFLHTPLLVLWGTDTCARELLVLFYFRADLCLFTSNPTSSVSAWKQNQTHIYLRYEIRRIFMTTLKICAVISGRLI